MGSCDRQVCLPDHVLAVTGCLQCSGCQLELQYIPDGSKNPAAVQVVHMPPFLMKITCNEVTNVNPILCRRSFSGGFRGRSSFSVCASIPGRDRSYCHQRRHCDLEPGQLLALAAFEPLKFKKKLAALSN